MKVTELDIIEQQDEVEALQKAFLRERGWVYMRASPNSQWLWNKQQPDGSTIMVNTETAISIAVDEEITAELDKVREKPTSPGRF